VRLFRRARPEPRARTGASTDGSARDLLGPDEIAFLICVEANRLEPQALLLCASIRRFGGRYRTAPIVAVAPREHLWLSADSQARLQAMDVTYVALALNDTGSPYGTINRIVAGAWAEATLTQPYLVVLDTDTIVVAEPQFVRADVGVRPVDVKGSATAGPGDPLDPYWGALCAVAAISLDDLPMLRTTIDDQLIRASYNGGFTVVRRDLGVLSLTRDVFFASFADDLRPLAGSAPEIKASTGFVGSVASEWWGSSQAALSVAVWATTSDVHLYDERYNIPGHSLVDPAQPWQLTAGPAVLVHYHYLAEPDGQQDLLRVVRRLGSSDDVVEWLSEQLVSFDDTDPTVCFCTLAIHEPYRERARTLIRDAPHVPWFILTDAPAEFAECAEVPSSPLGFRAVHHEPTGPMAVDYLERLPLTGNNRGAAAYHDKRFALMGALELHDTAIFLDADSRISQLPSMDRFPPGICVLPVVVKSVRAHLATAGSWRLPAFVALAEHLTGGTDLLDSARWCHESCVAITKDGRETAFFEVWGRAAAFLQERAVFSGEGGVIGFAAQMAGWSIDDTSLLAVGAAVHHEGGGPKAS
jgi:hypothetical protein